MKLLNLSEHRSCFNYQLNFASGFTRYKLAAQECGQVDNDSCFCILFLLKGELLVDIGQEHHISLLRNRMLLIPQREENRIKSVVPAECLLLFWNKQITACDKMYFESISHVKMENGNNCILPIRKPLLHILRQLLFYLDTGLLCRHMYILKLCLFQNNNRHSADTIPSTLFSSCCGISSILCSKRCILCSLPILTDSSPFKRNKIQKQQLLSICPDSCAANLYWVKPLSILIP